MLAFLQKNTGCLFFFYFNQFSQCLIKYDFIILVWYMWETEALNCYEVLTKLTRKQQMLYLILSWSASWKALTKRNVMQANYVI